MNTILVVVLILLLIGALPTWPYSANWGYYPSGGLGLVVVILLDGFHRYGLQGIAPRGSFTFLSA